jgi:hypothetical protein
VKDNNSGKLLFHCKISDTFELQKYLDLTFLNHWGKINSAHPLATKTGRYSKDHYTCRSVIFQEAISKQSIGNNREPVWKSTFNQINGLVVSFWSRPGELVSINRLLPLIFNFFIVFQLIHVLYLCYLVIISILFYYSIIISILCLLLNYHQYLVFLFNYH